MTQTNNDNQQRHSPTGERKKVADRFKTQLVMNNYGLPDNAEVLGLTNLNIAQAKTRIPAIFELWVRLDIWVAKGEDMKGSIDYPEARRRIDYNLITKTPSVNLKALVPERRRKHHQSKET